MHYRTFLVALMALCAITLVRAQLTLDPSLPKLTDVAFGWVSSSGVDPTLPLVNGFAPTMLSLQDAGYGTGSEIDYGAFSFDKLQVNVDAEVGLTKIGPGMLRVTRFGYMSNNAALPSFPDFLKQFGAIANTDGDSYELSYAQSIGSTDLGISVIPKDVSNISIALPGGLSLPKGTPLPGGGVMPVDYALPKDAELVSGNMETDYGVRIGGVQHLPFGVKLGADYSYQRDRSFLQTDPLIDMMMPGIPKESHNITRCGTVGASWQALPDTLLYVSLQDVDTTSDQGYIRKADLTWYGVQQGIGKKMLAKLNTVDHGFTKNLMVRANSLDSGLNLMGTWVTGAGAFTVSYTNSAVRSAKSELGQGSALIGGVNWAL